MDDEALSYIAITRLHRAYADVATRQAWPEMARLAIPGARFTFDVRSGSAIEIVGTEALAAFGSKSTEHFSFYEYIPLNTVVSFGGDRTARGRSYSLEVGEQRDTRVWIQFYGLYHDDYAHFEGAWRFARRQYQTIARRTGDHLDSFPLHDRAL